MYNFSRRLSFVEIQVFGIVDELYQFFQVSEREGTVFGRFGRQKGSGVKQSQRHHRTVEYAFRRFAARHSFYPSPLSSGQEIEPRSFVSLLYRPFFVQRESIKQIRTPGGARVRRLIRVGQRLYVYPIVVIYVQVLIQFRFLIEKERHATIGKRTHEFGSTVARARARYLKNFVPMSLYPPPRCDGIPSDAFVTTQSQGSEMPHRGRHFAFLRYEFAAPVLDELSFLLALRARTHHQKRIFWLKAPRHQTLFFDR